MTVTPSFLVRTAGIAAAVSGALFIGVQINHPPFDITSIATTEVVIRDTLKVLMGVLGLVGVTGMYLSQVRRNGVLGLIGYLLLAIGYLLIVSTTFVAAVVLPSIAGTDPAYVRDVLAVFIGNTATGDIGLLSVVFQVQGLCYLAGGLVFGIALYRAGVLARWAAALLAVGGVVSIVLTVLPDAFYRLLAFPNGVALIGLGYSLWRVQAQADDPTIIAAVEARPEHAAV